ASSDTQRGLVGDLLGLEVDDHPREVDVLDLDDPRLDPAQPLLGRHLRRLQPVVPPPEANASYNGRSVFAGTSDAGVAFSEDGTFQGVPGRSVVPCCDGVPGAPCRARSRARTSRYTEVRIAESATVSQPSASWVLRACCSAARCSDRSRSESPVPTGSSEGRRIARWPDARSMSVLIRCRFACRWCWAARAVIPLVTRPITALTAPRRRCG